MSVAAINDLHEIVDHVLRERSMDHRSCYTSVYASPPSGTVVFECSESDVGQEIRRRVSERIGSDVSIDYRLLPNSAALPECLLVATSVADVRREPTHAAELLSQVIYGEGLTPLKEEGDWWLVRLPDRYIGWVRSWHLKPLTLSRLESFERASRHRVIENVIQVFESTTERSHPVSDAVVGTRVVAESGGKRGWRKVTFADGRSGFAKSRGIGPVPAGHRVSRPGLAATGMRFLGIPYLWGGTTPKGFDCSGLVQRIYRLHGVLLPRDSDQQSLYGRSKRVGDPEVLKTGDLLFFGKPAGRITHVAMYVSNGVFLHAHGQVKVGALDPANTLFEPGLARDWCVTRDPLSS